MGCMFLLVKMTVAFVILKKMKKILCITRKYPPQIGGMENFCYNIFSRLECSDKLSTKVVALGKKQIHMLWYFPYTILYVMFNIHKYDVIIIGDGVLCFLGIISKLFSRKTKRIIIMYGLDFLYKFPIYQLYLRMWLKRSSDKFVCISHETRNALEKWGIKTNIIITPGINLTNRSFKKSVDEKKVFLKSHGINENGILMVTVGRLVKRKGVLWFVTNVMPHFKGKNIYYLVIGAGADMELIENAVKDNEIAMQVRVLGRVSEAELENCYKYSDIFIMPNIHVDNDMEGFGIVAAEASLKGLIVIASGIEGITDAIVNERNGYLLESENMLQYIEMIERIYTDLFRYKEKALEFSQYTAKHYSWDTIIEKWQDLILSLD